MVLQQGSALHLHEAWLGRLHTAARMQPRGGGGGHTSSWPISPTPPRTAGPHCYPTPAGHNARTLRQWCNGGDSRGRVGGPWARNVNSNARFHAAAVCSWARASAFAAARCMGGTRGRDRRPTATGPPGRCWRRRLVRRGRARSPRTKGWATTTPTPPKQAYPPFPPPIGHGTWVGQGRHRQHRRHHPTMHHPTPTHRRLAAPVRYR